MLADVMQYGGGRQTVAMCILIARGAIRKPDRMVMADTGRENPMTWDYLERYSRPLMREMGLEIEIAARDFAKVDLYSHQGKVLIPVFTATGKFTAYCSGEWKRDVAERYLRSQGITGGETWLGFSYDEKTRWKRSIDGERHNHKVVCPLVELMLTTDDCLTIIERHGWPLPHRSSCWMCPHKSNAEWSFIRDNHPTEFNAACNIDDEIRENDNQGGVWLHHSRVALRDADLSIRETREKERQCSLGMCFV